MPPTTPDGQLPATAAEERARCIEVLERWRESAKGKTWYHPEYILVCVIEDIRSGRAPEPPTPSGMSS